MTTNGRPPGAKLDLDQLAQKNGYPPPGENEGHTCRQCGAPVDCDLVVAMRLRSHAKTLAHIATKVEERERRRVTPGPTRSNPEWTTEDARRLLEQGLSFRAAGRILNAHGATVKRAVAQGKA